MSRHKLWLHKLAAIEKPAILEVGGKPWKDKPFTDNHAWVLEILWKLV